MVIANVPTTISQISISNIVLTKIVLFLVRSTLLDSFCPCCLYAIFVNRNMIWGVRSCFVDALIQLLYCWSCLDDVTLLFFICIFIHYVHKQFQQWSITCTVNVDAYPNEYAKHGCLGLYKWSLQMCQPPSAKFPYRTLSLQYICVDLKYLKYETITFNSHFSQEIMDQSWYELVTLIS
jgi:hypothetical protein